MPPRLAELHRRLVDEVPERRLGIHDFIQSASVPKGLFDVTLVKTFSFVEAIIVQDTKSKQNFLVLLEQELLPNYPDTFYLSRKLLCPLIEAYHASILDINFLGPILKLAKNAPKARFESAVMPLLLNLLDGKPASMTGGGSGSAGSTPTAAIVSGVDFTSPSQLKWIALQAMPLLIDQFTESSLSEVIYPHMVSHASKFFLCLTCLCLDEWVEGSSACHSRVDHACDDRAHYKVGAEDHSWRLAEANTQADNR